MNNTYVHNRLLEFDVKSVIRKCNDGILCSSYILCTLTMKFNERDLQNGKRNLLESIYQNHIPPINTHSSTQ